MHTADKLIRIALTSALLFAATGDISAYRSKPPRLTKSHGGWRKPLCFGCHEATEVREVHKKSGLKPSDCVRCHGTNGAPLEAHAIETNPCGNCHSWVEHFSSFDAPGDCAGCHLHPRRPAGK